MENSGIIPGQCLEGCREKLVLAAVIKPCQLSAGLQMLHFIESALELLALADSGYFKSM